MSQFMISADKDIDELMSSVTASTQSVLDPFIPTRAPTKEELKKTRKYKDPDEEEEKSEKTKKAAKETTNMFKELRKLAGPAAVVGVAMAATSTFLSGMFKPFEEVNEQIYQLGVIVGEGFIPLVDKMTSGLSNMEEGAEKLGLGVENLSEGVEVYYKNIVEKDWDAASMNVTDAFETSFDTIVKTISETDVLEDSAQFAASIVNGIGQFLRNLTIQDFEILFGSIIDGLYSFLVAVDWPTVLGGIVNGIVTAFAGLGLAIWNKVKRELGL